MSFHNILVNTPAWATQSDTVAIEAAARIAKASDASLTVFDVSSDMSWVMQYLAGGWEETIETLTGTKRKKLDQFAQVLSDRGLQATSKISEGRLSTAIIQQVNEAQHDLVIKVAEKSSNRSGFIGSTDLRLIHDCPCPVLIMRPDNEAGFQHVAVAADILDQDQLQRELDRHALGIAESLVQPGGALSLVYALPPLNTAINVIEEHADLVTEEQLAKWDADLENAALEKLRQLTEDFSGAQFKQQVVTGDPVQAIPDFAMKHGIDLLVMGSVARKGLEGFFLGNTAESILERVDCSVLVLKPQPQS